MVEVMKGTSVMYEGNLLFKRDESFTLQRLKQVEKKLPLYPLFV